MFGSLGYWHLIGQDKKQPTETLHGTIEQRASALLAMWRAKEIRQLAPDDNPGAAVDIARAMALELAVAAAARLGAGIPSSVIELVRELLPKWAYVTVDPTAVYSGDHAGKGAPDFFGKNATQGNLPRPGLRLRRANRTKEDDAGLGRRSDRRRSQNP